MHIQVPWKWVYGKRRQLGILLNSLVWNRLLSSADVYSASPWMPCLTKDSFHSSTIPPVATLYLDVLSVPVLILVCHHACASKYDPCCFARGESMIYPHTNSFYYKSSSMECKNAFPISSLRSVNAFTLLIEKKYLNSPLKTGYTICNFEWNSAELILLTISFTGSLWSVLTLDGYLVVSPLHV